MHTKNIAMVKKKTKKRLHKGGLIDFKIYQANKLTLKLIE